MVKAKGLSRAKWYKERGFVRVQTYVPAVCFDKYKTVLDYQGRTIQDAIEQHVRKIAKGYKKAIAEENPQALYQN